jgi:hypothetical protein
VIVNDFEFLESKGAAAAAAGGGAPQSSEDGLPSIEEPAVRDVDPDDIPF